MCLICRTDCDKCHPKFTTCPICGNQVNVDFPKCFHCHEPITKETKDAAQREWDERRLAQVERARKQRSTDRHEESISDH